MSRQERSLSDSVRPYKPRFARLRLAGKIVGVASVLGGLGYGGYHYIPEWTYTPPAPVVASARFVGGPDQDSIFVTATNRTGQPETVDAILQRWTQLDQLNGYTVTVAPGQPGTAAPGSDRADIVVPPHSSVTTRLTVPASAVRLGGNVTVQSKGQGIAGVNF